MSAADLLPTIQALSRAERIELYKFLMEDLEERVLEPLPEGFPPPQDRCPYTREQLERMRRRPGVYTLNEIWRKLDVE